MQEKRQRLHSRPLRMGYFAMVLAIVVATPWSDGNAQAGPPYQMDFHYISSGGKRLQNNCFVLDGTVGQTTPGYSTGGGFSILAGFYAATPGQDQLFYDGFERCAP